MMGRHHPRVAGVKLRAEAFPFQPVVNRIDARRHDQHRPLGTLSKEVAHRPIQRPSHSHRLARLRYESKGARNLEHRVAGLIAQKLPGLFGCEIQNLIRVRIGEINDSFDILMY